MIIFSKPNILILLSYNKVQVLDRNPLMQTECIKTRKKLIDSDTLKLKKIR